MDVKDSGKGVARGVKAGAQHVGAAGQAAARELTHEAAPQLEALARVGYASKGVVYGTIGLLALTYAFSHLEASRVAPLEYTGFVWAAGLGYVLFGETPAPGTWLSAGLIVAGCLLLMRR